MKKKILIVVADYYKNISKSLIESANKELKKLSFVEVIKVPGVFEIPVTIAKNIKKFDGFIALGCVIQGETPHFKFISKSTTDAIMNITVEYRKPIGNGILTCLNKKQAQARGKKGSEAAKAVLSILSL
tara:strand:- start:1981 stop:2367 length:387 start_codon:yes stop_codon:yes gene_type:complete